jgi:hypothetical protein
MSHELGAVKRREFRLELARIEVQRISPAEKHAIFPKEVSCTLRDKYIWLNKVDYHSRGQKLYKEIASFLRWSIRFINVQTFRHRQYGSYKLYCTIASDSGARNSPSLSEGLVAPEGITPLDRPMHPSSPRIQTRML